MKLGIIVPLMILFAIGIINGAVVLGTYSPDYEITIDVVPGLSFQLTAIQLIVSGLVIAGVSIAVASIVPTLAGGGGIMVGLRLVIFGGLFGAAYGTGGTFLTDVPIIGPLILLALACWYFAEVIFSGNAGGVGT